MLDLQKQIKNHIKIRILIPIILFILLCSCKLIPSVQDGFGFLFIFGFLILISFVYLFLETIYFLITRKNNYANANLKVFGFFILLLIAFWFIYIIYQNNF